MNRLKEKVHQKIEIAYNFMKEISLNLFRTKQKLALKLGLKNTPMQQGTWEPFLKKSA